MTTMLDDRAQIKQATIDVENIYDEIEIDDMEFEEDTCILSREVCESRHVGPKIAVTP